MKNKIILKQGTNSGPEVNKKDPGYIFILSNYGYPGVVKIGETTKLPDHFAAELTDSLSSPYSFVAEWGGFFEDDIHEVKQIIYEKLIKFQVNEGGGFFELSVLSAIEKIDSIIQNQNCFDELKGDD